MEKRFSICKFDVGLCACNSSALKIVCCKGRNPLPLLY